MLDFNIKTLKRNPSVIKKYLKTSGNIVSTSTDLTVMFPSRYLDSNMAVIDNTTRVIGIFAIIDNKNNYSVVNVPTMIELSPFSVEEITVDNVKYKLLNFHKDTVFIPNNKSVVNADNIYNLFNDFFAYGRVPWFLSYLDVSNIFLESSKYLGNSIGSGILAFEVLSSIIARDPKKYTTYYRLSNSKDNPKFIGLQDLYYSYNNTGAKLIGSYLKTGITTAILDPETKSSETTNILRK